MLRSMGYEYKTDLSKSLMFDGGLGNEDLNHDDLKAAFKGVIKREEEIPVEYEVNGIKVTGRPDLVLCGFDGTPLEGLEFKSVCSVWTARTVMLSREPKTDHLIQAAHYSSQLGIPFTLLYTSRVNWSLIGVPLPKTIYTPALERYPEPKPGFKHINPFNSAFILDVKDDHVIYKHSSHTDWITTLLSIQGIKQYYEHIAECLTAKKLPEPLTSKNMMGQSFGYSHCENYCEFNQCCKAHNGDFNAWLDSVRVVIDLRDKELADRVELYLKNCEIGDSTSELVVDLLTKKEENNE